MTTKQISFRKAVDAIEAVEASTCPDTLFGRLRDYTTSLGGTSLIIGRVVNPILAGRRIDHFGMSDWPDEWARQWVRNDLILHDPITQHARRARGVFDWEDAKAHGTLAGNRMLERGKDFNFDRGLAVPVMVGIMPMGLVSVGYDDPIAPEEIKNLELVASHAYVKLLEMIDATKADWLPELRLTAREIDVLSFTAAGKSAWEISRIYSISESTVKKHLASINSKLGTANKAHAVATALRTGQLMP